MAQILLVDDEPGVFGAIELALEGHEVLWAKDEREAEASIARTPPDLIILDYLMGHTPSIPQFLLALKRELSVVPILILTGHGSEEVAVESFRCGAHDYVKKPFDVFDLQHRVTAYLECSPSQLRPSLPAYLVASSRLLTIARAHPALRRIIETWATSGPVRLSLDDLAQMGGLSKRQIIRVFRDVTGMPPGRYFEGLRIEEAAYLLSTTGLSVSEVAARLEFSDASHFTKVFRKYMGVTPGAFRQQKKIVALSYSTG